MNNYKNTGNSGNDVGDDIYSSDYGNIRPSCANCADNHYVSADPIPSKIIRTRVIAPYPLSCNPYYSNDNIPSS